MIGGKKIAAAEKTPDFTALPSSEVREVKTTVDRFDAGRRLDLFLSGRYTALSRSQWKDKIQSGEVTLNGLSARASRIVQDGEVIAFSYRLRPEPEVDRNISILFEDEALLVIDKPGDLPIHASGGYRRNTLNEVLLETFHLRGVNDFVCRPAHRLDRETSGVIVYTKSTLMARKMTQAFLSGNVDKYYQVLVFGEFPGTRICEGWIGPDASSSIRRKQRYCEENPDRGFSRCRTDFHLISKSTVEGKVISALKARLYTGRMHQIRATLCSLGFPVVGDRLYGPDETMYLRRLNDLETEADQKLILHPRTALHCTRLEFQHPLTGIRTAFESPLPRSMANLMKTVQ